ncbi:MAG: lysophospholipid acyltransferase family protein [Promethearchaeota archaeon]
MKDKIPYPNFRSWMHERCHLRHESLNEKRKRWRRQPVIIQALEAVISRILVHSGFLSPDTRWVTFRAFGKMFRLYFKFFNRIKFFGIKNIPKSGGIFIVNHPSVMDPAILMASVPVHFGALISWGIGWFADICDALYGFVRFRPETMHKKVERIIRQILLKNRYFAIWPEGHPTYHDKIEQGFSSIVRVYAVINHDKDRIPFIPVLIQGWSLDLRFFVFKKGIKKKFSPIRVHILKPFFIDRNWLKPPEQGGKTPREIIDHVMMVLAKKNGQKQLATNPLLEFRRKKYKLKEDIDNILEVLKVPTLEEQIACDTCFWLPTSLQAMKINQKKQELLRKNFCQVIASKNGLKKLWRCPTCNRYMISWNKNNRFHIKPADDKVVRHFLYHMAREEKNWESIKNKLLTSYPIPNL